MNAGIKKTASILVICAKPKQMPAIKRLFIVGLLMYFQKVYIERKINKAPPMSAVTRLPKASMFGENEYKNNAKSPALIPYKSLAHRNTNQPSKTMKSNGMSLETSKRLFGNNPGLLLMYSICVPLSKSMNLLLSLTNNKGKAAKVAERVCSAGAQ